MTDPIQDGLYADSSEQGAEAVLSEAGTHEPAEDSASLKEGIVPASKFPPGRSAHVVDVARSVPVSLHGRCERRRSVKLPSKTARFVPLYVPIRQALGEREGRLNETTRQVSNL